MKTILTPLLLFLPWLLWSQPADSTAIRQVDSLLKVSMELVGQRNLDKALEVCSEAEKTVLNTQGKESVAYSDCCFTFSVIAYMQGNYPESEKWISSCVAIREKVLGKENLEYAKSIHFQGTLYFVMGQYEKVEPLFQEAMTIKEKLLGKENPEFAASENNLAYLYLTMGKYDKAEPLFMESKDIRERILGVQHPEYAKSLNNLAIMYSDMGLYEKSEKLHLETKSIREKTIGKEHPDYAWSLNNLAVLYYRMGRFEQAEPLYLESNEIKKKTIGETHPDYASSLNNLGALYSNMGLYKKAEKLYVEALTIKEKTIGTDHPDYAQGLYNLGNVYYKLDKPEKAESTYLEALDIQEKAFGKNHPEYAKNLNNLANLYTRTEKYEKAEAHYNEARNILENTLGKDHFLYAYSLNDLGRLYKIKEEYKKAEALYIQSKTIFEKSMGRENLNYSHSLYNLTNFYAGIHQYKKAEPYFVELAEINKLLLERSSTFLSESELNDYLSNFSKSHNQALLFRQLSGSPTMSGTCYDNSLFYKGFLLQSSDRIKPLVLSDPTSTTKYYQLKSYHSQLAKRYSLPISDRDSLSVAELEEKANTLEKELVRTVRGFGDARRQISWQEVQQKLKPNEAAIEFVHYSHAELEQTDDSDYRTEYSALLLRPGDKQPQFISLFEEKQLDSLLQSQGGRRADYVNDLYTIADRGARPTGKPRTSLYELIWQPLEKELDGFSTVYFSPSGLLHRLNLGAIPIRDEETLADKYHLTELGSTRQLVVPTKVEMAAQDAALFGGIEYEMDSAAIATADKEFDTQNLASRGGYGFAYSDPVLRGGTWQYLKWSDQEVNALEQVLAASGYGTTLFTGFTATEKVFKSLGQGSKPSPLILHIATHGFFFPDPVRSLQSEVQSLQSESVFKMSDHPMIRSGLILAGGNHTWNSGIPLNPDMEDGILTAYEISQMNLSNTELVVLSACETGLGDIQGNEGVYGLQRAFKIAGVKYLIMSLWQVPDRETSIFMQTFYKHWIADKMSIPDAFRTTQLEMRERFLNPYQWAGFVLVE